MKLNLNAEISEQLRLNKLEQEIQAAVDKGEFYKVSVADKYPFTYTIGLYELFNHPEILIFSPHQPLKTFLTIIQTIGENVTNGSEYKDGEKHEELIDNFPLLFKTIDRKYYDNYLGKAIEFYKGKSFPALCCLFPDAEGKFPSDVGCNKGLKELQTLRTK